MKRVLSTILAALLLAAVFSGCKTNNAQISGTKRLEALTVSVLKIGKADAMVLQIGESCLVIDAGEEDDGEELCAFLKNSNIRRVNALIITHYDKDHVGGADTLIENFPVDRVIMPDYDGVVSDYFEFIDALKAANITPERISEDIEFELGSADISVEPPTSFRKAADGVEVDNDNSLIVTVVHGQNRLLFMGDAEKTRIRDWLGHGRAAKCDFMKAPHHGVYTAALSELFALTRPKYAVICCSDKNPADAKTLETMKSFDTAVYETRFGDLSVISDGVNLELRQKRK